MATRAGPVPVTLAVVLALAGCAFPGTVLAAPDVTASGRLDMTAVDGMDRDTFVSTFGGIFEHSPWVAERAWHRRPFASLDALHGAMVAVTRIASRQDVLTLLSAHPELAGPEARARQMTAASVSEQDSAGLDRMSDTEFDRFDRLNAAYRARFGFPFIIAVRGCDRATILGEFERRLARPVEAEVDAALTEVAAITRSRLERKIAPAP